MGELAAAIVHEVNQPLTAIVANAQACLRRIAAGSLDPDELREVLEDVADDGQRANDVVQRIRGLMRKSPVEFAPLDLTAVVQDVVALVRGELTRRHISLRTNLAGDLPVVRGDRVQLQQVVLNLVMNAIEALGDVDAGARALTLHSRREGAGCVVVGDRRDSRRPVVGSPARLRRRDVPVQPAHPAVSVEPMLT
jgi:signal transduction histidine kinase